jgi:hypothetical protein
LGLLDQQVWARWGYQQANETPEARYRRVRESQCWSQAIEAVEQRTTGTSVIHVGDREEDIYEALACLQAKRFVIRASWNRRVSEEPGHLLEAVRQTPLVGFMTLEVPARRGQKKREVRLSIRRTSVTIHPPKAQHRPASEVVRVNVVEAREEQPPRGARALHWVLLTSEPIETLQECVRVIQLYSRRWKIEEFHMGLKTGCHTEERQLEDRHGLEIFLGLASVISTVLLRLRDAARRAEPAQQVLTPVQILLLRSKYPALSSCPTAQDALRTVARLGGFLARRGDGQPGWRTLWHGMEKLLFMEFGYYVAKSEIPNPFITCG